MQIEDIGFFLGTKEYGENSFIVFVLSKKHGLVKSFSKYSRKELQSLMILDQINFIWKSKQKEGLGFIKINHKKPLNDGVNNFLVSLVKASATELCLNFLAPWEKNKEIYEDLATLVESFKLNNNLIIFNYVWWEIFFLKNTGYGLNLDKCAVSGSSKDLYYISPNSGNCVTLTVGNKYKKKLFRIPECLKNKEKSSTFIDYFNALQIISFFLKKNFDFNINKLFFRTHLINKIENL